MSSSSSPPLSFDGSLAAANELFVSEEYDGAAPLYDAALQQQPSNTAALIARAANSIKRKQYSGQPHSSTLTLTESMTSETIRQQPVCANQPSNTETHRTTPHHTALHNTTRCERRSESTAALRCPVG